MRVLSCFSGGGLGDFGLMLAGMEIAGQIENDDYCQKLLKLRWPNIPKWTDIKNVKGEEVLEKCGAIDLVSGGSPCTPFSVAGRRRGKDDERYLWPEMFRIIREVRPRFVLAENVPGIIRLCLDEVLDDLETEGYTCWPVVFPASALGAPHLRQRLWIVAHAGLFGQEKRKKQTAGVEQRGENDVADSGRGPNAGKWEQGDDSETAGQETSAQHQQSIAGDRIGNPADSKYQRHKREINQTGQITRFDRSEWDDWYEVATRICRVGNGRPNRMERLKLLGNGQVVQAAQWIGSAIMRYNERDW